MNCGKPTCKNCNPPPSLAKLVVKDGLPIVEFDRKLLMNIPDREIIHMRCLEREELILCLMRKLRRVAPTTAAVEEVQEEILEKLGDLW